MRPFSRGKIELRSSNQDDAPRILVNHLSDPRDCDVMRKGIRLVREIVDQPAFAELKGSEIFPDPAVQSDEDLDHVLKAHTTTQWHL